MEEYERLEKELAEEYETYVERFRNLDYLEHELDVYNKVRRLDCITWVSGRVMALLEMQREREKVEISSKALRKMQQQLRRKELDMFMGDAGDVPIVAEGGGGQEAAQAAMAARAGEARVAAAAAAGGVGARPPA